MKILYTFSLIPLLRRYVHKRSEILNICLTQVFCDSLHGQIKKVLRDT